MLAEGKRLFFSRKFLLIVLGCLLLVQFDVIRTYRNEGATYQQGMKKELEIVQEMSIEDGLENDLWSAKDFRIK